MFASLAPARRRLVLAVIALVIAGAVAAIVAAVVNRSSPAAPVSQQRPGPVVLVPGYGGSTTAVTALAKVLQAHGKQTTVFHLLGNGTGDLDAQAAALGTTIKAVLARTQAKSVDVIGYSAGGVVARLWVPRPRRRIAGPAGDHARLAAPRHRGRGAGRLGPARCLPDRLPPAGTHQQPAGPAQRR